MKIVRLKKIKLILKKFILDAFKSLNCVDWLTSLSYLKDSSEQYNRSFGLFMLIQISFRIMEIKYTLISLNVKERQKKPKNLV